MKNEELKFRRVAGRAIFLTQRRKAARELSSLRLGVFAVLYPNIVAFCEDFLTQRTQRFAQRNAEKTSFATFARTSASFALNRASQMFGCGFAVSKFCCQPPRRTP